jgi:hypothetical protein
MKQTLAQRAALRRAIHKVEMIARRLRQRERDALVGDLGRQWTPMPRTGWRVRARAAK